MEKVLSLWEETHKRLKKKIPELKLSFNPLGNKEGYKAFKERSVVTLHAENQSAALFGSRQSQVGLLSGHERDFLKASKPRFPLRPLFPSCQMTCKISRDFTVQMPAWLSHQNIEPYCNQLFSLGFNAIIIGALQSQEGVPFPKESFYKVCEVLKRLGVKVILCLDVEENFPAIFDKESLKKKFSEIEGFFDIIEAVFWKSQHLKSSFEGCDIKTHAEQLEHELEVIQSVLEEKTNLIYYLPPKDKSFKSGTWVQRLLDAARGKTIISFSSTEEDVLHDHLPLHPIFSVLRAAPYVSMTPMMPIINSGCVEKGEGLWPFLNLTFQEKIFASINHHSIAGLAAITSELPRAGTLLDCSLWLTGAMQWTDLTPTHLLESWLKAFRPSWPLAECIDVIKEAEWIIQEIYKLRHLKAQRESLPHEKLRHLIESIAARIQNLSHVSHKDHQFYDFVRYFLLDAKRLLLHTSSAHAVSIPNLISPDDPVESFWTSTSIQNPLRKKPFSGEGDPFLFSLYQQHFLTK